MFAPEDEEAVALFSKATGQQLELGKDVHLNGTLSDETKFLLFDYVPVTTTEVMRCLRTLSRMVVQEEEKKAENLSTGSSGK